MSTLQAYLSSAMPSRERPSMDRLVAFLSDRPGMSRQELARQLGLSYVGVVHLLRRAERAGWVEGRLVSRHGIRSTFEYQLVEIAPPPGVGTVERVSSSARATVKKGQG